jgi:H+-transporting ATPase
LTEESLPVSMFENNVCMMGSTVVRGETEATVQYTGCDTFFGKTASLLQGDSELSNLQNILIDIMIVLVFLSSVLCTVVFIYLLGSNESVIDSLSFVVVLMVASIPLAIEIVTTTTLALGSKELSKHGAIVTRLSAIEDMAGMAILCSDKTGTLTLNTMIIQDYTPVYFPGETQKSMLQYAAMAAKWNEPPRDALDRLVLGSADIDALDQYQQTEYMPFDPVTKRTGGSLINKRTQEKFKVTKGAPHVLQELILSSWHLEGQSHGTPTSKSPSAAPVSPEAAAILATNKAIELDIKSLGWLFIMIRMEVIRMLLYSLGYSLVVRLCFACGLLAVSL